MVIARGTERCTRRIVTPACSKKSRIDWISGMCVTAGIGLTTLIMQLIPAWQTSTPLRRAPMTTEQLFLKWWSESYPNAKAAPHTVMSHVAFAEYVDSMRTKDVLDAISRAGTED